MGNKGIQSFFLFTLLHANKHVGKQAKKSIEEVVPNTTNECQSLSRHFTCENLFDNTGRPGGRGRCWGMSPQHTRSYRFSIMNTNQY